MTFCWYNRQPEYLSPIVAYPTDRHALEDFLQANPKVEVPLLTREALLEHAVALARAAFDELTARSDFSAAVCEKLAAHNATRLQPDNHGDTWPLEKLPLVVAENVINNLGELPFNRTDRAFWSAFGDTYRAMGVGQAFDSLRSAVRSLTAYDE